MKDLIVIDTNIIVNALKSVVDGAKSRQLMRDLLNGKYILCVSSDIVSEYDDVLHRSELGISPAKCLDAKLITRNHKDFPVHELVTLIDELY